MSAIGILLYVPNVTGSYTPGQNLITVDGQTFPNGSMVGLVLGVPHSVAASSILSGYRFNDWQSNIGTFAKNYTPSTNFYLNATPWGGEQAQIDMELQQYQAGGGWGGYTYYGTRVTAVGATLHPPQTMSLSVHSGTGWNQEGIVFWVGIGGALGNKTLWQVGVSFLDSIACNNGSSLPTQCADVWYEDYDPTAANGSAPPCDTYPCYFGAPVSDPECGTCFNLMHMLRGSGASLTLQVWTTSATSNCQIVPACKMGNFAVYVNGTEIWGTGASPIQFWSTLYPYQLYSPNWNTCEWETETDGFFPPVLGHTYWYDPTITDNSFSTAMFVLPLLNNTDPWTISQTVAPGFFYVSSPWQAPAAFEVRIY